MGRAAEDLLGELIVNGDRIKVCAARNPAEIPWGSHGVDLVLECTVLFASKAKASAHIAGGAKKVIVSSPGDKAANDRKKFKVVEVAREQNRVRHAKGH
ncbi:MAG: glyceraldehyde 3-phosphate dehydrogenase NAD-binding domain-containing protein [Hyphomicrobium sp.]